MKATLPDSLLFASSIPEQIVPVCNSLVESSCTLPCNPAPLDQDKRQGCSPTSSHALEGCSKSANSQSVPVFAEGGCSAESVPPTIGKRFPAPKCLGQVRVPDGGGCHSTADWSVPQAKFDLFGPLRKKFEHFCKDWDLVNRLRNHVAVPSPVSLFSDAEIQVVRMELVSFFAFKRLSLQCQCCGAPTFLVGSMGCLGPVFR